MKLHEIQAGRLVQVGEFDVTDVRLLCVSCGARVCFKEDGKFYCYTCAELLLDLNGIGLGFASGANVWEGTQ